MFTCDVCGKEYWEPEGLRTIQVTVKKEDDDAINIWGFVVCEASCVNLIRSAPDVVMVLTDTPTEGRFLEGQGYL